MKNKKGKTVAKENLPSKICVVCNRPFNWRLGGHNIGVDHTILDGVSSAGGGP
jgi:hypothetical protein